MGKGSLLDKSHLTMTQLNQCYIYAYVSTHILWLLSDNILQNAKHISFFHFRHFTLPSPLVALPTIHTIILPPIKYIDCINDSYTNQHGVHEGQQFGDLLVTLH